MNRNLKIQNVINSLLRKALILFLVSLLLPECSSFGPKNESSSLIILQVNLVKDELLLDEFVDPRLQKVTLRKGDSTYEYSENSEHYYYFQNLKDGQYEIYDAVHLLNRGGSDTASGSTKQPDKIDIDFDKKAIEATRLNLEPGSVVFMGTFNIKVNFKFQGEPEITVNFSKTVEQEKAAFEHLYKNFPRNGWGQKAKSRAKFIQSIGQ
ncbi:hypothetical protein EHQ58_07700 [Leptospira ognonensis]|uniref:Uncharacterized protein n=1 Tax=Leptospira ognonensis TaxID=2484945 RepID=A0A4R9K2Y8_9LEPT|nr:hypothetical protein [Leptospira ognonensis]TGL60369.1 hypothetical protein EHQ58_07700 [Leptospira ognonensis]